MWTGCQQKVLSSVAYGKCQGLRRRWICPILISFDFSLKQWRWMGFLWCSQHWKNKNVSVTFLPHYSCKYADSLLNQRLNVCKLQPCMCEWSTCPFLSFVRVSDPHPLLLQRYILYDWSDRFIKLLSVQSPHLQGRGTYKSREKANISDLALQRGWMHWSMASLCMSANQPLSYKIKSDLQRTQFLFAFVSKVLDADPLQHPALCLKHKVLLSDGFPGMPVFILPLQKSETLTENGGRKKGVRGFMGSFWRSLGIHWLWQHSGSGCSSKSTLGA